MLYFLLMEQVEAQPINWEGKMILQYFYLMCGAVQAGYILS